MSLCHTSVFCPHLTNGRSGEKPLGTLPSTTGQVSSLSVATVTLNVGSSWQLKLIDSPFYLREYEVSSVRSRERLTVFEIPPAAPSPAVVNLYEELRYENFAERLSGRYQLCRRKCGVLIGCFHRKWKCFAARTRSRYRAVRADLMRREESSRRWRQYPKLIGSWDALFPPLLEKTVNHCDRDVITLTWSEVWRYIVMFYNLKEKVLLC